MIFMLVGLALYLGGRIWLIVTAFRQSTTWGVCVLLVPCADLIFTFKNWGDAWQPFAIMMIGNALSFYGGKTGGEQEILKFLAPEQVMVQPASRVPAQTPAASKPATSTVKATPPAKQPEAAPVVPVELPPAAPPSGRTPTGAGKAAEVRTEAPVAVSVFSPDNIEGMKGGKLAEVEQAVGAPKMKVKRGKSVIWIYSAFEITSDDGQTVTSVLRTR